MKSLLYWRKSMINGAKTVPVIVAMDGAGILSMQDAAGVPVFSLPAPQAAVTLAGLEDWQQKAILNVLDAQPRGAKEKALLLRTLAEQIEQQARSDSSSPS